MLLKVFGKALGVGTQPTVPPTAAPLATQVGSAYTAAVSLLPRLQGRLRASRSFTALLLRSEARLLGTTVAPELTSRAERSPGRGGTLLVTWMTSGSSDCHQCHHPGHQELWQLQAGEVQVSQCRRGPGARPSRSSREHCCPQ